MTATKNMQEGELLFNEKQTKKLMKQLNALKSEDH